MSDAIVVEGLTKVFRSRKGEVRAVDAVRFRVPRGSIFSLIGPNGAGKTSKGWRSPRNRTRCGVESDTGPVRVDARTTPGVCPLQDPRRPAGIKRSLRTAQ